MPFLTEEQVRAYSPTREQSSASISLLLDSAFRRLRPLTSSFPTRLQMQSSSWASSACWRPRAGGGCSRRAMPSHRCSATSHDILLRNTWADTTSPADVLRVSGWTKYGGAPSKGATAPLTYGWLRGDAVGFPLPSRITSISEKADIGLSVSARYISGKLASCAMPRRLAIVDRRA